MDGATGAGLGIPSEAASCTCATRTSDRRAKGPKGPGVRGLHAEIPGQVCIPEENCACTVTTQAHHKKWCGADVRTHAQPGQKYKEYTREGRQRQ